MAAEEKATSYDAKFKEFKTVLLKELSKHYNAKRDILFRNIIDMIDNIKEKSLLIKDDKFHKYIQDELIKLYDKFIELHKLDDSVKNLSFNDSKIILRVLILGLNVLLRKSSDYHILVFEPSKIHNYIIAILINLLSKAHTRDYETDSKLLLSISHSFFENLDLQSDEKFRRTIREYEKRLKFIFEIIGVFNSEHDFEKLEKLFKQIATKYDFNFELGKIEKLLWEHIPSVPIIYTHELTLFHLLGYIILNYDEIFTTKLEPNIEAFQRIINTDTKNENLISEIQRILDGNLTLKGYYTEISQKLSQPSSKIWNAKYIKYGNAESIHLGGKSNAFPSYAGNSKGISQPSLNTYESKYLKYKNKYLKLKKHINFVSNHN